MKKIALLLAAILTLALAPLAATAADSAPSTVIHVVSVKWKSDATKEQIQAALDGVQALPKAFDGIAHVWTKAVKVQGEWSHVFVMEFKSAEAFKAYADSDAQKAWYKLYLPIRDHSNTHDITN